MDAVPPAATPERLTAALRRAGVLSRGEVVDVVPEQRRQTLVSGVTRLKLAYAGEAGPSHVFFKTHREGTTAELQALGAAEVAFYEIVAPATPRGLLPRCYDGAADGGRWHLILEDVSASHEAVGEWPMPPAPERFDAVVDAHARFHAAWWDDARLGVSVGRFADESGTIERYVAALPKEFATFADRLGDRLSAERRRLYERFIEAAPRLTERYRTHRDLTITHGDAHVWNAMLPKDPARHDVRLIDWDGWRVDTATDDLAYMMAVHFSPDWRGRYERSSLRRYHNALVAAGVRGFDFDALWADYRLSVLWQITMPMWQANHGLGPWIWWPHVDHVMSAVDDLACTDLLD
jgi:hypothetical protein